MKLKYYGQMSEQQDFSKSILKRLVSQAGGKWCGLQESVPPLPSLLLFNSPTTDSTLAIHLDKNLRPTDIVALIRKRIKDSDAKFAASTEKKHATTSQKT